MSFTGKATYSAGQGMPAVVEDVSDVVSIIAPYETPFLDAIGDPLRAATSTYHEWLEDKLLPNKDVVKDGSIEMPDGIGEFFVGDAKKFREGDQIQIKGSQELMLVTSIFHESTLGSRLTVVRGYAGTNTEDLVDSSIINILGNSQIEGGDKPKARFTERTRCGNYTQIFKKQVEVTQSDMTSNQLSLSDEMDYQKQERLREALRDLENAVINAGGCVKHKTVQRIMNGIIPQLRAIDAKGKKLDEDMLNAALKHVWDNSSGNVDLIVVGGYQKRQLKAFTTNQVPNDDIYESDFGVTRIVLSRWAPIDMVLLLDSSRVNIIPLSGRSFHFKTLATEDDYQCGEIIGEYTLELKNIEAHSLIKGLSHPG